jgi:uncharacterized protein with NRDE domain
MCLILISWQNDPKQPLTVAANRDEFFQRPTLATEFWPEHPQILAGKDLEFGGSWLGISRNGHFAAVTNLREEAATGERSRGDLVKNFLLSSQTSTEFVAQLDAEKQHYRPFNFIACDGETLSYINNVESGWRVLPAGIHAIGNILLSAENEKTKKGRNDMRTTLAAGAEYKTLLTMLQDKTPTDNLDEELYRALSCRFVSYDSYGTRSSSIVTLSEHGKWDFWEQQYTDGTAQEGTIKHFSFMTD